jgi:hypothetical protein
MASGIANKNYAGAPEGGRRGQINMDTVLQSRDLSNIDIQNYVTVSENKAAANAIDKMVREAATKGRPIAQMVKLTPAMAAMLLDRNPDNRKISSRVVDDFAHDIAYGRWTFNGEPIIVSDKGLLNDGQHRCNAVLQAGRSIDVMIIAGVSRDSRATLDQGRNRTAADYLAMNGQTHGSALAAAANYAWQYNNRGQLASGSNARATKSEIVAFANDNPALLHSVKFMDTGTARRLGGVAFLAFCHFALSQVGRSEHVDAFFIGFLEGANLGIGNPVLYARNRIGQIGSRDQNGKAELIFKAWNAYRRGKKVDRFNIEGGVLPVLEA